MPEPRSPFDSADCKLSIKTKKADFFLVPQKYGLSKKLMHKSVYSPATKTRQVLIPYCSTPPHLFHIPKFRLETPTNMGIAKNRSARSQRLKQQAFIAVHKRGASFRTGALKCPMELSTFHRHYHTHSTQTIANPAPRQGRRPALRGEEENIIVETLVKYAGRRYPFGEKTSWTALNYSVKLLAGNGEQLCRFRTVVLRKNMPAALRLVTKTESISEECPAKKETIFLYKRKQLDNLLC